jgi:PAS domain S-box-containing protein
MKFLRYWALIHNQLSTENLMLKFLDHNLALRRIAKISLFLLVGALAACSSTPLPEKQPPVSTLRVVMDNNYPPYVFQDEHGQLRGIVIDQWRLWEERAGVKVEITAVPWGEALERMKAGEFDVIDTIFYNADRAKIFDFTEPYAQIDVRIFFQNNISGIANAKDLKGFRVAVKSGDADVDYLLEQGATDLIYYDNYEHIVQAAKKKDVTIFVIDQPPALYYLYKYGIQDQFNYSEPLPGGEFHRAVRKGNANILALVKDGFSRITKAEYQAIDNRWLGSGLSGGIQQMMPFLAVGSAIALLIILVLFTFNRMLRSRVQSRTLELQEALAGLQKSEAHFRDAIEFFPVPIGIADVQGNLLSFNRKFVEFYGYSTADIPSAEEWMRRAYPDPEYRAKVQSQWDEDVAKAVQAETSTVSREYRVTCKDGSQRDVEIVMHPIGDLWITSFNNVTERNQVNDALRENRRFLADLIEYGGALIYVKDRDGRYELINRKWEEVTGLTREVVIGNTDEFLFPGPIGKQFRTNDLEVIESGRVVEKEEILDGEVARYFISIKFPIRDEYGNVKSICGMSTEITERKRMETALRESEEKYRTLIETINIGIFISTLDGKFLQANSAVAQMAGYDNLDEFMQIPVSTLYADGTDRERIINQLQSRGFVKNVEVLSLKKDGTQYWISISAILLKGSMGEPVSLLGSVTDITERRHSIEALQQSEQRFRTLLENSADALTLLNADGSIFYEGPTVNRLTGYSPSERLGRSSFDNVYPDDLPLVKSVLGGLLAVPDGSATIQFRSIRKDGSIWWAEGTAKNLLHKASVQAIVINYRDVTDRKRAEENLRESEERFRQIVEASPMGMHMYQLQGDHLVFVGANQAADHILGVDNSQFVGKTIEAAFPPLTATDVPEHYRRAASEGTPWEMVQVDYDHDGIRGAFETHAFQTGPGRMAAMFLDITERKKAEEKLRNSETRFRILFEHAGVGVGLVDTQTGKYIRVNQKYCDIVGYTREEMEQLGFQSITHPDDLQNDLDNMKRLKAGEISEFTLEKRYNRKDGKIVWVLLIVSPLFAPGEQPTSHITVVHDITDKKRTEYALQYSEAEVRKLNAELERRVAERTVQLEAANKELEAFSYSVSHDLRTPLRAIDGFSRIILKEHASQLGGEVQELLQHVNAESKRMGQLIDALLGLARMSRTEMRNETVDLSSLAHQVVDSLHQSQPQRLAEFVIKDGISAQGDARLLHIVLENLLGNAWKFTSKRKRAHIEFGEDKRENTMVYFVRDNGAGFDLAYADKLFGVFQRLHRSDEFEGTGIGLATVQRIIQRHGGRVWAEAEAGKGATFYFTLG